MRTNYPLEGRWSPGPPAAVTAAARLRLLQCLVQHGRVTAAVGLLPNHNGASALHLAAASGQRELLCGLLSGLPEEARHRARHLEDGAGQRVVDVALQLGHAAAAAELGIEDCSFVEEARVRCVCGREGLGRLLVGAWGAQSVYAVH